MIYIFCKILHLKKENYYSYENLDDLSIKLDIYDAIYLISFGSNTSGRDFIPYINSIKNFENLINLLSRLDKNVFIYHASSISIFNSGQLKLFNKIKLSIIINHHMYSQK